MTSTKKKEIVLAILLGVGISGLIVVSLACPNILQVARPFCGKSYRAKSVMQAFRRLDQDGWILIRPVKGGLEIRLSRKGLEELRAFEIGEKCLKKPKTWDGTWRLLSFDISQEKTMVRNRIRSFLKRLGFQRLHLSVWVYPYPCQDVLNLIRVRHRLVREAIYIETKYISDDSRLRKAFKLA